MWEGANRTLCVFWWRTYWGLAVADSLLVIAGAWDSADCSAKGSCRLAWWNGAEMGTLVPEVCEEGNQQNGECWPPQAQGMERRGQADWSGRPEQVRLKVSV